MNQLELLQTLRFKGRVGAADLATTLGIDLERVTAAVAELAHNGLVVYGEVFKLSPLGKEQLAALLEAERSTIDAALITNAYAEFRSINAEFKAVIADWQLKDGQLNDHRDAGYDEVVLARLDGIHEQVMQVIAEVAAVLPRLSAYGDKLALALSRVKSGDLPWLTRPIVDSYHTVWFELHEELIGVAGLTRDEEARAGHAG